MKTIGHAYCILSNFSEVFEIFVYDYGYPFLKTQISTCQHGFLKNRLTVTNPMIITWFLVQHLDKQGQMYVVYIDFSNAFDRIDPTIRLAKLSSFGFINKFIKFLNPAYITDVNMFLSMIINLINMLQRQRFHNAVILGHSSQ